MVIDTYLVISYSSSYIFFISLVVDISSIPSYSVLPREFSPSYLLLGDATPCTGYLPSHQPRPFVGGIFYLGFSSKLTIPWAQDASNLHCLS